MSKPGIKVFAPATVSGLAGASGVFGFALDQPGVELVLKAGESPGLYVEAVQGGGEKKHRAILAHAASAAAQAVMRHLDEEARPLSLQLTIRMPVGVGLGAAAACAAGGAYAVAEMLRSGLSKRELLPWAAEGRRAALGDSALYQTGPSLIGGMTLVADPEVSDPKKLYVPSGLYVALICPALPRPLLTAQRSLSEADIRIQQGHVAAFVAAMYTSDMELLRRALHGGPVERFWSDEMPHYAALSASARALGAVGVGLSGSGSALWALCDNSLTAERVAEAAQALYAAAGVETKTYLSKVNQEGAMLY